MGVLGAQAPGAHGATKPKPGWAANMAPYGLALALHGAGHTAGGPLGDMGGRGSPPWLQRQMVDSSKMDPLGEIFNEEIAVGTILISTFG